MGINVNAIGPGVIDTPLAAALAGESDGQIRRNLERTTPVGRVGTPADIAGLVNFMVGSDGAFMSGAYVLMDGGLRDARNRQVDPAVLEGTQDEMQRHLQAGAARRQKLEPLLRDK